MNDYLIYVGKNKGTIPGVPARNLSKEEADQFDIQALLNSKLYIKRKELSEINAIEMNVIYPNIESKPAPRLRRRKE